MSEKPSTDVGGAVLRLFAGTACLKEQWFPDVASSGGWGCLERDSPRAEVSSAGNRAWRLGTRLQRVGPLLLARAPKAAVVVDLQMPGWKAPAGWGRR